MSVKSTRVSVETEPGVPLKNRPKKDQTAKAGSAEDKAPSGGKPRQVKADVVTTIGRPAEATSDVAKVNRLQALINLQTEARSANSEKELSHIIANESRNIISARQIFVFRQRKKNAYRVTAVSSLSEIERNALLIRSAERLVRKNAKKGNLDKPGIFQLSDLVDTESDDWSSYPFRELMWQPFGDDRNNRFAGMLVAREKPWQEGEQTLAEHLGEIYSHAWRATIGPKRLKPRSRVRSLMCWLMVLAIILFSFIPVPMTALAPAQITARDATVIAAPIDGVVDEILVEPNMVVSKGQKLLRYDDTSLTNDVDVARRKVEIAQARERQYNQGAFNDSQAGENLAVAASELELAKAELAYAEDRLAKAVVVATTSGVAMFKDRDEWKGRPVKIGTRVLRISDPKKVELEVKLPVSDAISLDAESRIRFFLDTSPLDPIEATLVSSSYQATQTPSGTLAYTITGKLKTDEGKDLPRIGLSGVAQVFGEEVPLYYYLLRKPITSVRQFFGF